jgi:ankyrin repeat protein
MSKRSFLDSVEVASPCTQDWNEMFGNDEVRFCQHCVKSVHNLSGMTRKQAKRLVSQSGDNLCIRYIRRPDGRIQTAEQKLYKIAGRVSRLAAGVFGASLTLASNVSAQTSDSNSELNNTPIIQVETQNPIEVVEGTETNPLPERIDANNYSLDGLSVNSIVAGAMAVISYENPLVQAAYEEDLESIKKFLLEGTDVNASEKGSDLTALHMAVETGNIEITRELLQAGADVNARTSFRRTPLMQIDSDATPELVKLLLTYGAKLNQRDEDKASVLINAAKSSASTEVLQLLIQAGAKIDTADKDQRTALMEAANDENLEAVKTLLAAGANVNLKDKDGATALSLTDSDEIKQILKSYGALESEDSNEIVSEQ